MSFGFDGGCIVDCTVHCGGTVDSDGAKKLISVCRAGISISGRGMVGNGIVGSIAVDWWILLCRGL